MYTDLPRVTPIADAFKREINTAQNLKIKLLRAGIFSMEDLMEFPIGNPFKLNCVDVGVDRTVSLSLLMGIADRDVRAMITLAFAAFIQQRLPRLSSVLSVQEVAFLMERIPLFFSIEALPGGCYMVRI